MGIQGKGTRLSVTYDYLVGILCITQGEAERTAGRRAINPVGISERISTTGTNNGNVNFYFSILDGLIPPTVGAQHCRLFHPAFRTIAAQGTVHASLNMAYGSIVEVLQQVSVT